MAEKFDNPNYNPEAGMKYLATHFEMFKPEVAKAMIADAKRKGVKIPPVVEAKARKAGILNAARNAKFKVGDKVKFKNLFKPERGEETGVVTGYDTDGSVLIRDDDGIKVKASEKLVRLANSVRNAKFKVGDRVKVTWYPDGQKKGIVGKTGELLRISSEGTALVEIDGHEYFTDRVYLTLANSVRSTNARRVRVLKAERLVPDRLVGQIVEVVGGRGDDVFVKDPKFPRLNIPTLLKKGEYEVVNANACNASGFGDKFRVGDTVLYKENKAYKGIVQKAQAFLGRETVYTIKWNDGKQYVVTERDLIAANSTACNSNRFTNAVVANARWRGIGTAVAIKPNVQSRYTWLGSTVGKVVRTEGDPSYEPDFENPVTVKFDNGKTEDIVYGHLLVTSNSAVANSTNPVVAKVMAMNAWKVSDFDDAAKEVKSKYNVGTWTSWSRSGEERIDMHVRPNEDVDKVAKDTIKIFKKHGIDMKVAGSTPLHYMGGVPARPKDADYFRLIPTNAVRRKPIKKGRYSGESGDMTYYVDYTADKWFAKKYGKDGTNVTEIKIMGPYEKDSNGRDVKHILYLFAQGHESIKAKDQQTRSLLEAIMRGPNVVKQGDESFAWNSQEAESVDGVSRNASDPYLGEKLKLMLAHEAVSVSGGGKPSVGDVVFEHRGKKYYVGKDSAHMVKQFADAGLVKMVNSSAKVSANSVVAKALNAVAQNTRTLPVFKLAWTDCELKGIEVMKKYLEKHGGVLPKTNAEVEAVLGNIPKIDATEKQNVMSYFKYGKGKKLVGKNDAIKNAWADAPDAATAKRDIEQTVRKAAEIAKRRSGAKATYKLTPNDNYWCGYIELTFNSEEEAEKYNPYYLFDELGDNKSILPKWSWAISSFNYQKNGKGVKIFVGRLAT